jgi:glucosamine-6-phosphate deaminase
MEVIIKPNPDAVSKEAAGFFRKQLAAKPASVLGLATGGTPLGLYRELATMSAQGRVDFSSATTFNLDEYVGLGPEHPQSYAAYMRENLFARVSLDPARTHLPDGRAADIPAHCEQYEDAIRAAGGIDLQLLGIGSDGHIGFNEPGSALGSRTRIKTLTRETIRDNARFFGSEAAVPHHVITMGVGTIMEARHCLVLATGAGKAEAVAAMAEGPITAEVPASALQFHRKCTLVIDEAAAAKLKRGDYYRWVYDHKPEWQRV